MEKVYLPDGESNPGLLRDRQGSLPLDYRGFMCVIKFPCFRNQHNLASPAWKTTTHHLLLWPKQCTALTCRVSQDKCEKSLVSLILTSLYWKVLKMLLTQKWLVGLGVWFALRVREVPGSNPGRAHNVLLLNKLAGHTFRKIMEMSGIVCYAIGFL